MSAPRPEHAPRKSIARRLLSFNGILWLIALATVLWLVASPLALNAWAARHWVSVPCHVREEDKGFSYTVDDQVYISSRRDFWEMNFSTKKVLEDSTRQDLPNGTCWVNPHDAMDTVLFLDAPRNLSNGTGRFVEAGLILAAVAVLTILSNKQRRKAGHGQIEGETGAEKPGSAKGAA